MVRNWRARPQQAPKLPLRWRLSHSTAEAFWLWESALRGRSRGPDTGIIRGVTSLSGQARRLGIGLCNGAKVLGTSSNFVIPQLPTAKALLSSKADSLVSQLTGLYPHIQPQSINTATMSNRPLVLGGLAVAGGVGTCCSLYGCYYEVR